MSERDLLIRRIQNGTVLDHLKAGSSLHVFSALDISGEDGNQVSVAMNVPSKRIVKKDIIKVENRFLRAEETNRLALMAPNASVNIVRDYKVVEKRNVEVPSSFVNIFKCTNPTCITNSNEPIVPELKVIRSNPAVLQCRYCSRILQVEEVVGTRGRIYG
ncbi:MAG: aspartate carbamoyltransferase regulatory subunit [Nitrososphaerales archaeon]